MHTVSAVPVHVVMVMYRSGGVVPLIQFRQHIQFQTELPYATVMIVNCIWCFPPDFLYNWRWVYLEVIYQSLN